MKETNSNTGSAPGGSLHRLVSLTHDLEECHEWIEILESLAYRCGKHGLTEEHDACVVLLATLTLEREHKKALRPANDRDQARRD